MTCSDRSSGSNWWTCLPSDRGSRRMSKPAHAPPPSPHYPINSALIDHLPQLPTTVQLFHQKRLRQIEPSVWTVVHRSRCETVVSARIRSEPRTQSLTSASIAVSSSKSKLLSISYCPQEAAVSPANFVSPFCDFSNFSALRADCERFMYRSQQFWSFFKAQKKLIVCKIWSLDDTPFRFFANRYPIFGKYLMEIFFLQYLNSFLPVRTGIFRFGSKMSKN